MASVIDEIVTLRQQVEYLREENRYLKNLLRSDTDAAERKFLRLQRQEWRVLQVLRSTSPAVAPYERLLAVMKSGAEDESGVLRNRIYTLRCKLRKHAIKILTSYGDGIFLNTENKMRLEALLEDAATQPEKKHAEKGFRDSEEVADVAG